MKNYVKNLLNAVLLLLVVKTVSAQELYLEGEKAMKNMETLELSQFTVSFMTSEAKSANTQSINNFNGAKSALKVITNGLSKELMQKITDDAYEDFVKKAQENGFTVSSFDVKSNLPGYLKESYPDEGNFMENCDHYQVNGTLTTMTVSAKGDPCQCNNYLGMAGYAAKESGKQPISISYLIGSGYLAAKAKVTKNEFMGEVYNKTSVKFFPGVQVWWRSGVDIWQTKSKKGEIKINSHIIAEGTPGKLVVADQTNLASYSRATLQLNIDPQKYYNDAILVLKEANSRLVAAMVKAR